MPAKTDLISSDRELAGFPESASLVNPVGQPFVSADGKSIPVSQPHLNPVVIVSTPVVDTNALATGDLSAVALTQLTGVANGPFKTTWLQQIVLSDAAVQSAALELWFFDTPSIVLPALNAAWAISDAEALRVVGVQPISAASYYASSNNSVSVTKQIALGMKVGPRPDSSLWYAIISRGAPTYAAANALQFTFTFFPDA